jgi:hypothetical protein
MAISPSSLEVLHSAYFCEFLTQQQKRSILALDTILCCIHRYKCEDRHLSQDDEARQKITQLISEKMALYLGNEEVSKEIMRSRRTRGIIRRCDSCLIPLPPGHIGAVPLWSEGSGNRTQITSNTSSIEEGKDMKDSP